MALTFFATFHGEMGEDGHLTKNQANDSKFHNHVIKAPFDADIYDRCVEDEGHVLNTEGDSTNPATRRPATIL